VKVNLIEESQQTPHIVSIRNQARVASFPFSLDLVNYES